LSFATAFAMAQEQISPVEAKLRDTLRNTMLQLRNVETERARLTAELQAVKTQTDKKIKELTAELEAAVKRGADEKALSDKVIAEQKDNLAARDEQIGALTKLLEKWKISHVQITDIARAKEIERARLESKSIALQRTVEARERQNIELYQTGKEILDRYQSFALGRALLAREPFTGLAKVRLEEEIQDYKDKIDDGIGKPAEDTDPGEPAGAADDAASGNGNPGEDTNPGEPSPALELPEAGPKGDER
jgi:hypothetical protein